MRSLFTILTLICLSYTPCVAQEGGQESLPGDTVSTISERLPVYPGGAEAMWRMIQMNASYPESAQEKGIGGTVWVGFEIDTMGNVVDLHVARGINEALDAEAIRLVSLLNGWEPALQRGKKVKVQYRIPIRFAAPPPSKDQIKRQRKEEKKKKKTQRGLIEDR